MKIYEHTENGESGTIGIHRIGQEVRLSSNNKAYIKEVVIDAEGDVHIYSIKPSITSITAFEIINYFEGVKE